jgi:formylglycine-generating enzyme required for sulfatase activity
MLAGVAFVGLRSHSTPAPADPASAALRPLSGGELVQVPAGDFTMGQDGGLPDEAPHAVSIASFYMDRFLVTQEQYEKVMGSNPSKLKGAKNPVERVQWTDAVRFCNRCSELDGLTPCYDLQTWGCRFDADGYRLPTEAQWEYACRAGSRTRFFFGDDPAGAAQYAWCKPQSEGMPHPVGRKLPNAWGLYDMLGNVWEWCNDWYSDGYYQQSPGRDPPGPTSGRQRVLRGGAWDCAPETCTAARRFKEFPFFTDACFGADTYGFRRVRNSAAMPTVLIAGPRTRPATAPDDAPAKSTADAVNAAPVMTAVRQAQAAPGGKLRAADLKGTIVFVSDRSGTLNIWSMRADGSDPRPLTSDTDPHADPRFSPDGKSIVYTVLRGGFPQVWVMNRDGSAPRKVTPGSQADWSPDGRQIAFIRDNQVWVRDLGTTLERRLTPPAWERCGVPAWRPDGKQLAVASRHTGAVDIYLLSPDGKEITPLTTEDESCTPRWSRDGQRLLCQTVKGHIHQVGADGRNWEQETSGADVQHEAQYSPDGSLIVFCRAPSSDGPWEICVSRLGDGDMDFIQLTSEGSNLQPDWQTDR